MPADSIDYLQHFEKTGVVGVQVPRGYGRLNDLGLFEEVGVSTSGTLVEIADRLLYLVPAGERGGVAYTVRHHNRAVPFMAIPALTTGGHIAADEVQNLRGFGTMDTPTAWEDHVDQRTAHALADLAATLEHHRMGAIRGRVLDHNAAVVVDLFEELGLEQQTLSLDLAGSGKLADKARQALDLIDADLKSDFDGGRAFVGADVWAALLARDDASAAYQDQAGHRPPGERRESFELGGIVWERYRGQAAGWDGSSMVDRPFIEASGAYLIPEGVPSLFRTIFAPPPYSETVNTLGLPMYLKYEPTDFGHGLDFEATAHPLCVCVKPRSVIKLTA